MIAGNFDQSILKLSSFSSDTAESEDDFETNLNDQEKLKRPRLNPSPNIL